jgi:hypothetical protein
VEWFSGFTSVPTSDGPVLMERSPGGFEEITRQIRGGMARGIETAQTTPQAAQTFGLNVNFSSGIPQKSKSNEEKMNSEVGCSEHYTIPPIETVASTVSVPSFVVGRKGYGSISFKEPVNLTGISSMTDLCEVVVIEMKRVSVYLNKSSDLELGKGMNVSAKVSMENIRPPPGTDIVSFTEMLKSKPDTDFVMYDAETGVWVFEVNHFSSYGVYSDNYTSYGPVMHRTQSSTSSESSHSSTSRQNPSLSSDPTFPRQRSIPSLLHWPPPPPPTTNPVPPPHRDAAEVAASVSPDPAVSHTLRSNFQYDNPIKYAPCIAPQFAKAFKECYDFFCRDIAIPPAALAKLSEFTLSAEQFYALVIQKELPKGRFIYMENGHIKFDEWTMPPHAEIIGEVITQIAKQDIMDLWEAGSGGSTHVFMLMLMMCRRQFDPRS